ncbi:carbonic anhydrase family protein [Amycolatopsis magusensis]|uniref:carbonic anhydrase family protein n=1 Tax=Amycolatopsis magusensis TaxID=882444 RepID=UPI0024A97475|nr:carbonic anhydrase family protein [Amycolatopsis magusensis]MDI5975168.1 carbonic anhydrase family protein [Amycolatopsis magusensis]
MIRRRFTAILLPLGLAVATLTAGGTAAQSQLPMQSPINVTPGAIKFDPHQPRLNVAYGHSELELEYVRKDAADPAGCTTRHHEETEEAVVTPGAGHVTVAGVRYELEQFHFHTPSEHRFAGHADPLEMHFVHRSAAGRLLVIGVPLRAGTPSTVDTVLAALAPECGSPVAIHDVDLKSLLPSNLSTLRYNGSLTTYPFSEDVQWFLTAELTVSQATITRFQSLFTTGNARPTQPLNHRPVTAVPHL